MAAEAAKNEECLPVLHSWRGGSAANGKGTRERLPLFLLPMKKKKTNPNKRPATWADVERAKKQATNDAIKLSWSILFYALADKKGMTVEELKEIWQLVDNVSDSVVKGYANVTDFRHVLREEYGIDITD